MTHEEFFTALFRRHYGDVERYVLRRAPDLAVADVVAEVFLVAWRRLDTVPRTTPLPWLYAVARNTLANHLRRAGRERQLLTLIGSGPDRSTDGDHSDEVSSRLAIAAAFDRLSEADQEVLRLVAWERLGIREGALALGCGVTTFAMRLLRARRRLRAALGPPGDEAFAAVDALLQRVTATKGAHR